MEVKRYRKKPVEVEAVQWAGGSEAATPIIDWILTNGGTARWHEEREAVRDPHTGEAVLDAEPEHLEIDTLEGTMWALPGDWIIRGVAGEFYPCKPSIFDTTYEPVSSGVIEARSWHGNGRVIRVGNRVRPYGVSGAPVTGTVTRIWRVSPHGIWRIDIKTELGRHTAFAYAYEAVAE